MHKTRRTGWPRVAALILIVSAAALWIQDNAKGDKADRERPNIVVIDTDDQRFDDLDVMKNVRKLIAKRGTTFTNAHATTPTCCPSRSTYLTGQYAHNHGVISNSGKHGGYKALDHSNTLPLWLQDADYRTAHVGKYLNGYDRGDPERIPPGWEEWYTPVNRSTYRMFDYDLNENGEVVRYGGGPDDYQTDVLADKAVDFIREEGGEEDPFFLSFQPTAPHTESHRPEPPDPRPAPRHAVSEEDETSFLRPRSFDERDLSDKPKLITKRDRLAGDQKRTIKRRFRDRRASLKAVDDAVGRIVAELVKAGELQNTLLIFQSDNGYLQGEHRLTGKVRLYEESTHVPLLVAGPAFPRGVRRDQLVANIDVAPTIVEAARAEPNRLMDGRSLMPLARDRKLGRERDLVLETERARGLRTPRFLYVRHPKRAERELYDLKRDPDQLQSRHDDRRYRRILNEIKPRLEGLRSCTGAERCSAPSGRAFVGAEASAKNERTVWRVLGRAADRLIDKAGRTGRRVRDEARSSLDR